MTVDEDLIRRVELWCTGATIHNAKNLIGAYRASLGAARQDRHSRRRWLWYLARADTYAAQLESWMRHGDYSRARDANPLPPEPLEADATPGRVAEVHRWALYAAKQWLHSIGEAALADSLRPAIRAAIDKMGE